MFDHVGIRVADGEASERFYATVLGALEVGPPTRGNGFVEWDDFSLAAATADRAPTRGLHVAFAAPTRAHVDAFWRAGTEAGYEDDGAPGPRPQYREDYYGAFLRDPDGNSAEAVHHGVLRRGGIVDHLWIRVADVAASTRFWETVAPHGGFGLLHEDAERAQFGAGNGSFSVVRGTPTERLHVAFPAPDDATVEAFHRAAVEAGYRDNGGPGERPEYHAGYYGAFVLDPDGNNVELVCHHRP